MISKYRLTTEQGFLKKERKEGRKEKRKEKKSNIFKVFEKQ